MSADVLVLNRNFYAIHIADWQRALSLVYLDHARVVDQEYRTYTFEDWRELSKILTNHPGGYVHTPTFRIAIPEVIALRGYDKMPVGDVKFTRRNIYEHYGHRCCYCGHKFGTQELNLEHVLPRSRGGRTDWANIVTACIPCNLKKADRLPHEAGMKLLIKPTKPKWRGSASLVFKAPFKIKASWQRFIDNVYWNTELES
ncbi:MAG TPA: HNH endonuclease [Elusimicrobiota bacterium]|nr:HNH endonuclease [Elusimicrobiota bacterium]